MKLLLIAPPHARVARGERGPGGQVALLAEALLDRGHDVAVCSSEQPEAAVPARVCPLAHPDERGDPGRLARLYAFRALSQAAGFDMVHSFAGAATAALAGEMAAQPFIASLPPVSALGDPPLWQRFTGFYTTVSWSQALALCAGLPRARFAGVLHPTIDVDALTFEPDKGDTLLTMGPVGPERGTDLAIVAARKAGVPLTIVGPVAPGAELFFAREIEPRLDGLQISYRAAATAAERERLLASARCLLITARRERPWDRDAVEAAALGTPVVALNRGAARELVAHAETGFLAEDLGDLISAIDQVDRIDPRACRRRAERLWDVHAVATACEQIYESLRAGWASPLGVHPELEALDPREPLPA